MRDSLRFTLADGTYKKTHVGLGDQVASSYVADLTAKPYWDPRGGAFPWMEFLEEHYLTIRDELRCALADPLLEQKGNAIWVAAARDDAEGYGPDWRTLVLQDRCEWEPSNVLLFPKTVDLVKRAATPSVEVFFAKQAPQTGIKPHTDFTNFIMTAHLGLDVPPKPESWMKVGEETQYWENGKGMCADTSFIHSTYNESLTMDRYVLIVRLWHPALTKHERNGVRFLFDAFEDLSPEGLRRAQDNARARTKADAEARRAAAESDGSDGVSEAESVSSDEEDVEAFNPFRALGIDAEGEAQYGTADIDADEGAGRFKMKAPLGDAKGAAATYFGRGGDAARTLGKQGGGGSVFLSDFDLRESTKGTREKGGKKSRR